MVPHRRIDLHTHSLLSDGVLLPSELLRRVAVLDYAALAISDHADASNLAWIIASLRRVREEQCCDYGVELLVGVELTHVGPTNVARLARQAKHLGAEVVVVHGETIVEPVAPGTNRAAVESPDVDVLAHPGFLTSEEAALAARRGCYIEITTRKGHSLTNGHVARVCRDAGAQLVVDSDSHEPSDLPSFAFASQVAAGAGMSEAEVFAATVTHPLAFVARILAMRAARQSEHNKDFKS
jgi:histidinol phosphatase-like PHP family hydrolase